MRYLIGITVISWAVLVIPEWPLPEDGGTRTIVESAILSFAYLGAFGTPGLLVLLVLNRLVNVSFDIHYGKDKNGK